MDSRTRNILTGVGSIVDIMPRHSRRNPFKKAPTVSARQIDTEAWNMVGQSFRQAMRQVRHGAGTRRS